MGRAMAIGDEHIIFALKMADAARRVLTAHAGGAPGVSVKPDRSLVTQIDLMIEAELRAMIAGRFPSHGIIGEEAGAEAADAAAVWIIDPIDGTAPFIAGLPVYGTLIALAIDGRTHHAVVATSRERVLVSLDGRTYVFAAGEDGAVSGGAGGGTGKITAPTPGKVIAILVAPGDHVEHGQGVLVIEAMKMETTLTADVDGEVTRIAAAVGETVDGGALLVEITPA